ncbi:hypothetical protein GCM10011504_48130 [Siccirubricoccus deserti]|uniref:Uncharacterized protein n=1 Tax=Siccirubricoccus deserti TaxID=2013562 RepID=A0A9X0R478_9PROT|nr:hypothetical protein [Siccirubricoccus deserti]MBC4018247.1 hypothetical protein [Siccirubricoccus deserti]GGC64387.1 hypothetical protein GCM10011504_48130 [Siccirubricoccus deserti]
MNQMIPLREKETGPVHLARPTHPLSPTMSSANAPLDVVLTENDLCDRLADAMAGAIITYHIGMLARDRDKAASQLPPDERLELIAVAERARRFSEAGLAHLVQRRVGEERFAYLLIVRSRPRNGRSPLALAMAGFLQGEAA